jgi:hypothetical protein
MVGRVSTGHSFAAAATRADVRRDLVIVLLSDRA